MERNFGRGPWGRYVPGPDGRAYLWWYRKGKSSRKRKSHPRVLKPEDALRIGAHHEAAHAVVAIRLGFKVDEITLEQTESGGVKGAVSVARLPQATAANTYRALAVLVAGALVHCRFDPTLPPESATGDESMIARILDDGFSIPQARQSARLRAMEIAQGIIDRDWDFIAKLAYEIATWRRIEHDFLMKIAAAFDPRSGRKESLTAQRHTKTCDSSAGAVAIVSAGL